MNNYIQLKKEIPHRIKLVVVSKTQPPDNIFEIYNLGHRIFAENKVQELINKQSILPEDIEWHFIGHLQTNKVRFIAPFVSLIHSVDSFKLLKEINKEALNNNRIIDCLLEFYIAKEETKYGLNIDECESIIESESFSSLNNIRICGVMGMASFSNDNNLVRNEFIHLKQIFIALKSKYFSDKEYFKEISMGMSNDYKIALEEGATMLRIGSVVFN